MNKGEQLVADKYKGLGFEIVHFGVPDFLLLKEGKLSFVEVKSGEDWLSKNQIRTHEILLRHGFEVSVEVVHPVDSDNSLYIFEDEMSELIRLNKTKSIEASAREIIKNRVRWTDIWTNIPDLES